MIPLQLYKKGLPSEFIETRFGKITRYDWFCKERDRINRSPGRKAWIEGGECSKDFRHSQCCFFVNKIV